ncbi:DMT family transporter [Sphaerotilus sp.]|uniref:DMT family transporter n=1 Tax=Sphaerotilus sp. TaxID=2093942 RepID=UPI0034E2D5BB
MRSLIPSGKPAAIGCTLAALAFFVSLDTTTKVLAAAVPVVMVVWFRYLFQVLLTVATVTTPRRRTLHHSRRPGLQVLRGLMLVMATVIAFYSLKVMPIAEFTAVVTLTPLFVTLLAVWRLDERVTPLEWLLVLGGLVGALVVIRPTHDLFHWATLLPLLLVLCNALFQMLTRRLAEVDDVTTTQFYTGCVGTLAATLLLPWTWQTPPSLHVWGLLLLLCVFGSIGHLLLIMAYARAPVATLTPFLYFQIVFAGVSGWFVFGHVPDLTAFAGITLIGLCGSLGTWLAARMPHPSKGAPL